MKYSEFRVLKQNEEKTLDSLKLDISKIRSEKMDAVRAYLKQMYNIDVVYHTDYELAEYLANRFDAQIYETQEYFIN